jgi:hypothetical protein
MELFQRLVSSTLKVGRPMTRSVAWLCGIFSYVVMSAYALTIHSHCTPAARSAA